MTAAATIATIGQGNLLSGRSWKFGSGFVATVTSRRHQFWAPMDCDVTRGARGFQLRGHTRKMLARGTHLTASKAVSRAAARFCELPITKKTLTPTFVSADSIDR